MRVDLKVACLVLAVLCQIYIVDGWGFRSRRSSSSRSSSSRTPSARRSSWFSRRTSSSARTPRVRTPSTRRSTWFSRRTPPSVRTPSVRTPSSRRSSWFSRRTPSSVRTPSVRTPSSRRFGWSSRISSSIRTPSSRSSSRLPHGLTNVYNKKVVSVQTVERPLNDDKQVNARAIGIANKLGVKTSISGQKDRVTHSGVLVTTEDRKQYLVHKGKSYGKSAGTGETVVEDAKHMSGAWKNVDSSEKVSGETVGDFVKAGGTRYRILVDNCHDATERMKGLG